MQQPAGVGGQLLGFRPGQQHAIVQRMQKSVLAEPLFFFHQVFVHDGNLAGWPAEAVDGHFQPDSGGFAKSWSIFVFFIFNHFLVKLK
jgi:hypothetical protein